MTQIDEVAIVQPRYHDFTARSSGSLPPYFAALKTQAL